MLITVIEDVARVLDAGGVEDRHGVLLKPTVDGGGAGGRSRVFDSGRHFFFSQQGEGLRVGEWGKKP